MKRLVCVNIIETPHIVTTRGPATVGGSGRRSLPLVKVVLSSRDERNRVLSLKPQLSTKEPFKHVFIEPVRQGHERLMNANMHLITRKCLG